MIASKLLQSKFDKVKSFIDNESFVFTFAKSKALAIHKDQLFKNQLYNSYIGPNGLVVNEPINGDVIKYERIKQLEILKNSFAILYDSGRLVVKQKSRSDDGMFIQITAPDIELTINGNQKIIKDSIDKFLLIETDSQYDYEFDDIIFITKNKKIYHVLFKNNRNTEGEIYTIIPVSTSSNDISFMPKNIYNFGKTQQFTVLSTENILYFYDIESNITREVTFRNQYLNEPEKLKYLKDIKCNYYDETNDNNYAILNSGKVYKIHINQSSEIELIDFTIADGYSDEIKNFIKQIEIKDLSFGLNHMLILTTEGKAYGIGDNYNYQLGENYSENPGDGNEKYKVIELKFNDKVFSAIKATEKGTILLSTDGKLVVTGMFEYGELAITSNNLDIFISEKLVTISKAEVLEDGSYTLKPIFNLKLYNTFGNNVFVIKEDGKLYYTGDNSGIKVIGDAFGNSPKINVWTPVESGSNDILRRTIKRQDYWSYYFDYIMKIDNNGDSLKNIFFKIDNVWIDWNAYISKYSNVTLRDSNNIVLPKYKKYLKYDNSDSIKTINIESFITYLKLHKDAIIGEFEIDRKNVPQVEFIDKDLKVWTINNGDNYSAIKYTQDDIDFLNRDYIDALNEKYELRQTYQNIIDNSEDPAEIINAQDRLAILNLDIEDLEDKRDANLAKLGEVDPNYNLDFAENNYFNPMEIVGTEQKSITYSRSIFTEPDEYGDSELQMSESDGNIASVKEIEQKTVDSNITKLKIELINYDRITNPGISDSKVLRDDIKFTIMDDPNDETEFTMDDLLIWLDGKFITKDFPIDNLNKSFCNYNGLASVETRRICEFPGLGEPTQNSNIIPTITGENSTVIEPTIPTELRWNLSVKTFSWNGVKIDGPYKIHDLNNVDSELRRLEYFYYGSVYCGVFSQIMLKNKYAPKNTFILFFDGAVVPEDEYDVVIKDGHTYINLKTFTKYVVSLLQDLVDVRKPGYEGSVRHIVSQFDEMNQFSIAFLSATDKYKKVKMFYDYQNLRDVPKPGQVLFNDINYNDLVLIDGYYIPYLWESLHCIRIPETVNTIRSSENSFIHHSTICNAKPYLTYKKESELSDNECRSYALENGLITENEASSLDIFYIRERVKPHIEARIKEI